MKRLAFIFPGQGSQCLGMGKDFFDNFEIAKEIFNFADKILGKKISSLCFEGTENELKQTKNTQLCLLVCSVVGLEILKSKGITPHFVAGHSLGEYVALYAAGVIDLDSVLKIVNKRASLMSEVQKGTMAAVLGLDDETVLNVIEKIEHVQVANYNCIGQIVITGDDNAVSKASEILKEKGAKRVIPLSVSGAFHSELMRKISEEFAIYINNFKINDAKINVITNVDAKIELRAENFKEKMPKQLYSSVQWTKTIQEMIKNGVGTFVEIGSGKVLAGLNRKINSEITTYNVFDTQSLNETLEKIGENNG